MRHVLVIMAWLSAAPATIHAASWQRMDAGLGETSFVAVRVDSQQAQHIFSATPKAAYFSTDAGAHWQRVFLATGQTTMTKVALRDQWLLVATDHGVFSSGDAGAHWRRTLLGTTPQHSNVRDIALHPSAAGLAIAATEDGAFLSQDSGRTWQRLTTPSGDTNFVQAAFDSGDRDQLYLVSAQRLLLGNFIQNRWETLFHILGHNDSPIDSTEEELEEPSQARTHLTAVAVNDAQPHELYLAAARSVYTSFDRGAHWQPLPQTGLPGSSIARLVTLTHSPTTVYAATHHGVVCTRLNEEHWRTLTQGMTSGQIHDMAATPTHLWAATEGGLYTLELSSLSFESPEQPPGRELLEDFSHEPRIDQVQEAAIRYAEVYPEKIKRWRQHAALRAILPDVRLGVDRGRSLNAHYDEGTFPHFQVVDTQDHDSGADLSITWELGDLIWNPDQTSIDVRSKLMVELRQDLIEAVTRTYFERRRLQVNVLTHPALDPQAQLEQELKLQELTAMLDGLTGGYFSEQMAIPTTGGRTWTQK